MKRVVSLGVAIALFISSTPKPIKANPVILLAPELCATGVGCILVGTIVVGGALYYVYKTHDGKKVYSHHMLDDPENPEPEWSDTTNLRGDAQAQKKCREIAARHGAIYLGKKRNAATGIFECYFKGGNR